MDGLNSAVELLPKCSHPLASGRLVVFLSLGPLTVSLITNSAI